MKPHSFRQLGRSAATLLALGLVPGIAAADIVISQVYGGGGNSGATYRNDFVELFNAGTTPQNIGGWSIQYTSATGANWTNITPLPNATVQPGQYFLVQQAAGAGGTTDLPTPDATGSIALSGTAGKVALVNSVTALTGVCPQDASIVDFVGFGSTANCSEGGSPTPAPSNTAAVLREGGGCVDTNHNSTDFVVGPPAPRNTASPTNLCAGPGAVIVSVDNVAVTAPATGTTTANFTVSLNQAATSDVTFDITTADGSAISGIDYNAANQNGATITAGNTTFTFSVTILANAAPGPTRTFKVKVDNIAGGNAVTTSAEGTGTIANASGGVRIGDIQGDGAHPALLNQSVTFTGVVTAKGPSGFFVQDEGDGNPLTSDAIYVFGTISAGQVSVGKKVKVSGNVIEYYGLAEIGSPSVTVLGDGILPAPIVLDASTPSADPAHPRCEGGSFTAADGPQVRNWRCLQSMRVTVTDARISAPNFRTSTQPLNEAYAYVGSHPRPMRGPGLPYGTTPPSPPAGYAAPVWDAVPYVFAINPRQLMTPVALNGGARFDATGVMSYDFGFGTLWPTSLTITDPGPDYPVAVPQAPATALTIGSQNMLRLFNDVHDSGSIDACADTSPGSADVCPTPAQFEVRLKKLSRQIRDVLRAPAVVGVQEVENLATLQSLAAQINADQPGLGYTAHLEEGNDIGGIDVGYLVRGDVTVNAVHQLGKDEMTSTGCSSSNPPPCKLNDRPALLLDAALNGERFAVLVLHNRSLSNVETQAYVRAKRFEQALSVARIAQAWQTGDSASVPGATAGVPLVIVGDYNAFQFTDGYVDAHGIIQGTAVQSENLLWDASLPIVSPALFDTADGVAPETRYSFMYGGYAQKLDHGLATADLQPRLLWTAVAHGNADIPAGSPDATDPTNARRSADHDGFVIAFRAQGDNDTIFKNGFDGP